MSETNADKLQSVISDDLFPHVQHVSDVKQVIEVMRDKAQNLREPQLKAIIYLKEMGENNYLHGEENPYENIIKEILTNYKIGVADPNYYLDTITELIPKPPRPILFEDFKKQSRR